MLAVNQKKKKRGALPTYRAGDRGVASGRAGQRGGVSTAWP